MRKSEMERFREKTAIRADGCWEWTGAIVPGGYGHMYFRGRSVNAHCAAYTLLVGDIPLGADVHHTCEHRWCVNPAHLEPLSRLEHQRRTPRSARNRTHCPKGHALAPGNLVASRLLRGQRICLTCNRTNALAAQHRWLSNPENRAKSNAARQARRAAGH